MHEKDPDKVVCPSATKLASIWSLTTL